MSLTNLATKLPSLLLACLAMSQVHAQKTEPLILDHNAEILCAQYDEGDNLLITASANGIVKLWDPETGSLIRSFGSVTPISKGFYADFSPDGKAVATINGRAGKVWNTKYGDLLCSLTGYGDTIKSIHFSDDNKWLITASMDGTAKLWDVQTGKRRQNLNHLFISFGKKERQNSVTDARFCDKNRSIITGCGECFRETRKMAFDSTLSLDVNQTSGRYDSTALMWDMKTGKVTHVLKGYPFDVSPDGGRIVSGSVNMTGQDALVWDAATGNLIFSLSGHTGKVTACQFSRNGKWILTASSEDRTCRLWDAASGKIVCYLNAGPSIAGTYQLSPDGKLISTFSHDTTRIWNVAEGRLLHSLHAGHPPAFSNNSRYMVILTGMRAAVYETVSGNQVMVEKKAAGKGTKKVLKVIY